MEDQRNGGTAPTEKPRRFRVTRRVKLRARPGRIETRAEREPGELAEMGDDADRGTPEQDAALQAGCMSMVRVAALFFLIILLSIIVTWVSR